MFHSILYAPVSINGPVNIFEKNFEGPNQLNKFNNAKISRRDLLDEPKIDNAITEQGVRENLNEGIEYLAFWVMGTGCCVVNYLMADAATCEVSRAQLWIWLKYKVKLNDGRTVDKKLMINVYEENDLQPDPKVDTDIYWALVKHVIPHDDCRKHFLDCNAWIIQNKGKKVRHGIILQSDEFQLGKGSLYDVNRDILGRVNAKKIELEQALDKGKGYLVNSIMCLIDEAKNTGKWEEKQKLINTLKMEL